MASLSVTALGNKMGQNVEVIYSYNFQMMGSSKAETEFHSSAMNKLRMSGVQIWLRVHTKLRNKDFQKKILKPTLN